MAHDGGVSTATDLPGADALTTNPAPKAARMAWLAGLVAGLVGIAVAQFLAWLLATGSPIPAVGEAVISVLPSGMIEFGKQVLGLADKPILLGIVTAALLALTAAAGRAELRKSFAGLAILVPLAAVAAGSLAISPESTLISYLPTLAGLALAYPILRSLTTRVRELSAPTRATDPRLATDRRRFLRNTVILGAVAGAANLGGWLLNGASTAVAAARSKITLPLARKPAPPAPAGADLGIADLAPYRTPNADFYRIDTSLQPPQINPDDWSLTISGMVEQEVTISYAELLAKPLVEHFTTLTCVSNEVGGNLVGNALWLGYPLRDLLAEAKPLPGADMVLSTSEDGWTAGTPLEALTDPTRESLLAVGMNGEPLPVEHGFPVRMVVPGLYGYVSATKWVTKLKVTTFVEDYGYWTPLGWAALGPIKTASRIDVPSRNALPAGPTVVAGVAWDQHTGIKAVEVQVDDGPWNPATLADTVGPDTWRQWSWSWSATPGEHRLRVRATNADGEMQTEAPAPPAPDGASGWHEIRINIRD